VVSGAYCQFGYYSERLGVTLVPLFVAFLQKPVEFLFANVPERRVAQIVSEGGGFGDFRIKIANRMQALLISLLLKTLGKSARYLGDLERVGKSVMDNVAFDRAYDLRHAC
jgi:hypothetical protein